MIDAIKIGKKSFIVHPDTVAINGVRIRSDIAVNIADPCVVITPNGRAAMSEENRPHVYANYEDARKDVEISEPHWLTHFNAPSADDADPKLARLTAENARLQTELSHYRVYGTAKEKIAALERELGELREGLKAREHECSLLRDHIRKFEPDMDRLAQYGRELDEIGRVMGCDHKDDGYMRCVTDTLADRDSLRSRLGEAKKALTEIRDHNPSHEDLRHYCRTYYDWMKGRAAAFLAGEEANDKPA